MPNIFKVFKDNEEKSIELEETLFFLREAKAVRIKSKGHVSTEDFWYEQRDDEWVIVLSGAGEIEWPCGRKRMLKTGDWLFLPRFEQHRVSYTSTEPPCVWLAIYGQIEMEVGFDD